MVIRNNAALASISLPKLGYLRRSLIIRKNPLLTYLNMPLLVEIENFLQICENNAAFVVPTTSPNAPAGGFNVDGLDYNGYNDDLNTCTVADGDSACSNDDMANCP
jgi:hypothetical protein